MGFYPWYKAGYLHCIIHYITLKRNDVYRLKLKKIMNLQLSTRNYFRVEIAFVKTILEVTPQTHLHEV